MQYELFESAFKGKYIYEVGSFKLNTMKLQGRSYSILCRVINICISANCVQTIRIAHRKYF